LTTSLSKGSLLQECLVLGKTLNNTSQTLLKAQIVNDGVSECQSKIHIFHQALQSESDRVAKRNSSFIKLCKVKICDAW